MKRPTTTLALSRLLKALTLTLVVGCGADAPTSPPPPPPPPPPAPVASVVVSPDSAGVFVSDTLTLRATTLDAQGNVLTGRSVTWSTSSSAVATVSTSGLVTAITGGRVVLTATAESRTGTAVVTIARPDTLPAAPQTPIGSAIPDSVFRPGPGTYRTDHPSAPGMPFSPSVLTVSFQASATTGQVNQLIGQVRGRIVGGISSKSSVAGGMLIVRIPGASHAAMETALAVLRASPLVRAAVQNQPASFEALPVRSATPTPSWTWEVSPQGGNWAFETARIPELWHFNDLVQRSARRTDLMVVDGKFYPGHEDLTFETIVSPDSMIVRPGLAAADYHGTMVASIAGATFGNGRGIDGVDPFVRMTAMHLPDDMTEGLRQLGDQLIANPAIRVINQSLGLNWSLAHPLPNQAFREAIADQTGQLFVDAILRVTATGRALPYIVTSAGNDALDARQNGWFANAGLQHGFAPVIVVEALQQIGPARTVLPAGTSNNNGHLSAGGAGVLLAVGGSPNYALDAGTSFAAPFVAGLVSYLLALDPSIPNPTATTNPIRDLLVASGQSVSGGARSVDGFAAVLELDRRNGNQTFGKALVDIDDGTPDGNQRVRPDGTIDAAITNFGDGRVDIRDFRRFRDWYLEVTSTTAVLDGAATHPKKDLNGDGVVEAVLATENVYPRGDFNGDGIISETAKAAFGKNGPQLTDLEVLQRFFIDPDYQASDLPTLLESGDLRVDPVGCAVNGAALIRTEVRVPGTGSVRIQAHATTATPAILTVAALGTATPYEVVTSALDGASKVLTEVVTTGVTVLSGSDQSLRPVCPAPLTITTTSLPGGTVGVAYSAQLAVAGGGPGPVTWSIAGGALPTGLSLGPTNGTISGTPAAACQCSVTVKATRGTATATRLLTLSIVAADPVPGSYSGTFFLAVPGGGTIAATGSIAANIQPGGPPYLLKANWPGVVSFLICGVEGTAPNLSIDQFGCSGRDAAFGLIRFVSGTVSISGISLVLKTDTTNPYGTLTLTRVP